MTLVSSAWQAIAVVSPVALVSLHQKTIDRRVVGLLRKRARVQKRFELVLDVLDLADHPGQGPLTQSDLHTRIPRRSLHRKSQAPRRQELHSLVAKTESVHCTLGVVTVPLDELGPSDSHLTAPAQ